MITEKRYVYALDGENFIFESEEDVLEEAQGEGYSVYQKGVVREVSPRDLIDVDDVQEILAYRAEDIAGEYAEFYPEFSDEAGKEMEDFLHQWIEKHCKPTFYLVEEVEELEVPPKEELDK